MAVHVALGERSYDVHFRPLVELPQHLTTLDVRIGRALVVTDENVGAHYRTPFTRALEDAGWTVKSVVLPPGESTKSASHLQTIYDEALSWGIDRQTPVFALGGGVIGDLAGFAAATLLRGVPLVHVPTSLLAQVDAAVGGKTAINHDTGKNLIGAFYQPKLVWADPATLDTLPRNEYTGGLAEVVKHALIGDVSLIEHLETHLDAILGREDPSVVATTIERAVQVKANVVSADEHERGRRAVLNFGHTFGHAIEAVAGYGTFSHGEAVAVGMRAGLFLSHYRHPSSIPRSRLAGLIRAIPVTAKPSQLSFEEIHSAMASDKKNVGTTIRFVLLDQPGHAYVADDITRSELRRAWAFACNS